MIMNRTGEVIYLVDNDRNVRESLRELLAPLGYQITGFSSAAEYLDSTRSDTSACLILDMHLPDMHGLALQQKLGGEMSPPIIFISGQCDICTTVSAMKGGAVHFLLKPLDPDMLLAAIGEALQQDRTRRRRHAELITLRRRYATLTARERQVFSMVADGVLNKQIAGILKIADVTVALHRGNVMRKMEAGSFAQLVKMAVILHTPSFLEQIEEDSLVEFAMPAPAEVSESAVSACFAA
jgi:FixJ family two-component response regulator